LKEPIMENDIRYPLFNTVIDQLVDEVQALSGTGKIAYLNTWK